GEGTTKFEARKGHRRGCCWSLLRSRRPTRPLLRSQWFTANCSVSRAQSSERSWLAATCRFSSLPTGPGRHRSPGLEGEVWREAANGYERGPKREVYEAEGA